MFDPVYWFRDFFATGGNVLWLILILTIVLWWLMLDRWFYFRQVFPAAFAQVQQSWQQRADKSSWYGESIRRQMVSELDVALNHHMKVIPGFIALLPMLGLLGTVTGMIQVFDVLAITGTSNPQAMADGVSAATVPTMAGMVAALSAIPISAMLDRRYKKALYQINDRLPTEATESSEY